MSYESLRAEFKWQTPAQFNFARDVMDRWADQDSDKLALLHFDAQGKETRVTFEALKRRSSRLANALSAAGLRKGDPVIIILGRQIAWWESVTAAIRAGWVFSPGTTQLSAKDIAYRIEALGAVAVITDNANTAKVDEIANRCRSLSLRVVIDGEREGWLDYESLIGAADEQHQAVLTDCEEEAIAFFTSGTTGSPKMAMHNHGYGLGHVTTGKYWLDLKPDDLHWNISDTGWAKAAWSSYFGPWLCGAALFVHDTPGFNPTESLSLFARFPITTFCGAPTIYRMFVQHDLSQFSFPTLRHCVGAGEPLNPEVIETWRQATGLVIRDGYGQTETVILCGNMPGADPRFGSMGKPMPGIDLAVIDELGNPLPAGEEGEIAVRVKPEAPQGLFMGS